MAVKTGYQRAMTGLGASGLEFAEVKNGRTDESFKIFQDAVSAAEVTQKASFFTAKKKADNLKTDGILVQEEAERVQKMDFFLAYRVRQFTIRKALDLLNAS